jgi:hypothetical protein
MAILILAVVFGSFVAIGAGRAAIDDCVEDGKLIQVVSITSVILYALFLLK